MNATYSEKAHPNQPEKYMYFSVLLLFTLYNFFSEIMTAVYVVYWLMPRIVPKLTDSHCSHRKPYSDIDFRYTVDHSGSTKLGFLLFQGVGYWFLQCRWAVRYSVYPSTDTRDSVFGR